jgi:hypothetical protein
MPLVIDEVFIVLHGLLFMSYNSSTGNLDIRVPNLRDHHFVGGTRGNRVELSFPLPVDMTTIGLKGGKPTFPGGDTSQIPNDIKPAMYQFRIADTNLGDFDPTNLKGMFSLPWPIEFHPIRCDDISSTFPYDKSSVVGSAIDYNSRTIKKSKYLSAGTCLRYKLDNAGSIPGASHLTIHFYFQPCKRHNITEVNSDLRIASHCFKNDSNFDLQLLSQAIPPTSTGQNKCGDTPFGLTFEDENSLDEEKLQQDISKICPLSASTGEETPTNGDGDAGGVSPANCPTFYVG